MEDYQALYRRFRPQTFSDMVGQHAIVQTLRNQVVTGRTAHAYLFCGSRGTGKTSAAKILARAVNCQDPQNGDPCGVCQSCRTILSGTSLDVEEVDAASNSKVEQMRDLLAQVDYPPQFSKKKVYIIDEVHMLSASAFNALLKTLEEPPEYMIFILATTDPQKVPATILSRCQRFDFGRFTEEELVSRMRLAAGDAKVTDEALSLIAQTAEGGMRDALSMLDMCMGLGGEITEDTVRAILGAVDRPFLFAYADTLARRDQAAALRMTEKLFAGGNDVSVFIRDLSRHVRFLAMAGAGAAEGLSGVSAETAERYREQAKLFSRERLVRLLDLLMRAEADARWASSPRAVLELCVLRACEAPEEKDLTALMERIGELEARLAQFESGQLAVRVAAPAAQEAAPARQPETTAPAVPASGADEADEPVSPDDGALWKKAADEAVRRSAMLSFLPKARFAGRTGNEWTVTFSEADSFYIQILNRPANQAVVEESLKACGAEDPVFRAALAGEKPKKKSRPGADRSMEKLSEIFGRENIQLTDN